MVLHWLIMISLMDGSGPIGNTLNSFPDFFSSCFPCPAFLLLVVAGGDGIKGLENRVDSGEAQVAFYVSRVSVGDIMRVADAGQLMPPKATCFDPKPLAGLMVRLH
jgi:hypothetical protein